VSHNTTQHELYGNGSLLSGKVGFMSSGHDLLHWVEVLIIVIYYLQSDDELKVRKCYPMMRHEEGDVICPRDCILLKSGPRKTDLPFVAKVAALWENPDDGELH
jgi:hypothetical protein